MGRVVAISVALWVGLACVVAVLANAVAPLSQNLSDFVKVVGIGLTLVTSLIAGITAPLIAHQQMLGTRNLEIIKNRISSEQKAYEALYSAAARYYYTLSTLEVGFWNSELSRMAESKMIDAVGFLAVISPENKQLWREFWQEARRITEAAEEHAHSAHTQKALWRKYVRDFGSLLRALEEAVAASTEREE